MKTNNKKQGGKGIEEATEKEANLMSLKTVISVKVTKDSRTVSVPLRMSQENHKIYGFKLLLRHGTRNSHDI